MRADAKKRQVSDDRDAFGGPTWPFLLNRLDPGGGDRPLDRAAQTLSSWMTARPSESAPNIANGTFPRGPLARHGCAGSPFRGRPPRLPFSGEARAFVALRCAPTRAAGPTMSTVVRAVLEKRATRTRTSARLSGCVSR